MAQHRKVRLRGEHQGRAPTLASADFVFTKLSMFASELHPGGGAAVPGVQLLAGGHQGGDAVLYCTVLYCTVQVVTLPPEVPVTALPAPRRQITSLIAAGKLPGQTHPRYSMHFFL